MITFKCGKCNISFNIEDEYALEKEGSQQCPNCGDYIEFNVANAARLLVKRNLENSSKAYVSPNKRTTNEGTLTFYKA